MRHMRVQPTLATLALAASATAAHAHHAMDSATPATFLQGLVSGLAHPVIGLDHLAFVVAMGLLAAPLGRGALMPLAFLVAGAIGAALHVGGLDLPGVERLVALSVVALGALVLVRRPIPAAGLAALFAAAGLFHGHALAESIVGAEPTPLAAYFAGLVAVQYAIALAAMLAARWAVAERPGTARTALTAAGATAVATGLAFLILPASP